MAKLGIQISFEDGETQTKYLTPLLRERVVSINCDLYFKNTADWETPFLDSTKTMDINSSQPFIIGLKALFGDDIEHKAFKDFMVDLENGTATPPSWEVDSTLNNNVGGYYNDSTIHINESLILEAEKDPTAAWLLFRVMLEEVGHYVDDKLRNQYSDIGGDAEGDEGSLFGIDFILNNKLLSKGFEFADFEIKGKNSEVRSFKAKVDAETPSEDDKVKQLVYTETDQDDHGELILSNGEKITVEFFKIRDHGAVHEMITKEAAKQAGVTYDRMLANGCAWPDAPYEMDQDKVTTAYYTMLAKFMNPWHNIETDKSLINRSHHLDLQYWHSMSPTSEKPLRNHEVVDLIVEQAKVWYKKAIKAKEWDERRSEGQDPRFIKENYYGLFQIGKILHMVQDSYSESHVYRNSKNEVIMIQSYTAQDSHNHGTADAINQEGLKGPSADGIDMSPAKLDQVLAVKGAKEAIEASVQILSHFVAKSSEYDLELFLRNYVYKFGYMDEGMSDEEIEEIGFYDRADGAYRFAGGSLAKFKPKEGDDGH